MRAISCMVALALMLPLMGCMGEAGPSTDDVRTDDVRTHATGLLSDSGRVMADIDSMGAITEGPNDFLLRLSPTGGAAATRVEISAVSALMPAHAHDAKPAQVTLERGVYRIHDLRLTMAGRWEITVSLREDGVADTLRFSVEVP